MTFLLRSIATKDPAAMKIQESLLYTTEDSAKPTTPWAYCNGVGFCTINTSISIYIWHVNMLILESLYHIWYILRETKFFVRSTVIYVSYPIFTYIIIENSDGRGICGIYRKSTYSKWKMVDYCNGNCRSVP